jgi:hypothetical protein
MWAVAQVKPLAPARTPAFQGLRAHSLGTTGPVLDPSLARRGPLRVKLAALRAA